MERGVTRAFWLLRLYQRKLAHANLLLVPTLIRISINVEFHFWLSMRRITVREVIPEATCIQKNTFSM
jgi:hypothetical protein